MFRVSRILYDAAQLCETRRAAAILRGSRTHTFGAQRIFAEGIACNLLFQGYDVLPVIPKVIGVAKRLTGGVYKG